MGTNYYAHLDVCPHCERAEQIIHIGKASCGWAFSFHATDSIRSWGDWKVELQRSTTKILDEYGEAISFIDFEKLIEFKQNETHHNHSKMVLEDDYSMNGGRPFGSYHKSQCFLDDEGNSFQDGEFS